MALLCLVLLLLFAACQTLVASHNAGKNKSGCHFWIRADPKTISENGSLQKSPVSGLYDVQPVFDPKTFIFGSRNGVLREGLRVGPKNASRNWKGDRRCSYSKQTKKRLSTPHTFMRRRSSLQEPKPCGSLQRWALEVGSTYLHYRCEKK